MTHASNSLSRASRTLRLLATVLVTAASVSVQAADYSFTLLEPLVAGRGTDAVGINNAGVVIGHAGFSLDHHAARAVVWEGGNVAPLQALGEINQWVSAINDSGDIVGGLHPSLPGGHFGEVRGLLLRDGQLIDLGPGRFGVINDAGLVGGWTTIDGRSVAVLTDGKHMTRLGEGAVSALNNWGDAVGVVTEEGRQTPLAVLWKDGERISLSDDSDLSTEVVAINDAGAVAGAFVTEDWRKLPFLWADGHRQLLSLGDEAGGETHGVNNAGQVVGRTFGKHGLRGSAAALWEDGAWTDLNQWLPDELREDGWVLWTADAINDRGVIVGGAFRDWEFRSFVLTPVPEPGSAWMALAGLAAVGLAARRRHREAMKAN